MTFFNKRLPAVLAGLLVLLSGPCAASQPLTVAVAANVKYAFDELAAEFTKETGIEVQGVPGSSGKLAAQVQGGAPFDVFLSADSEAPEALYHSGLAVAPPKVYAYGALVLWTTKELDLSRGFSLLAEPGVHRIAVPNPRLAPYGRAAMQALEKSGLKTAVEPKLVYGESISQAAQFVESGAADIGFSAKSIVVSPEMAGKGKWIEVPPGAYQPIAQAVVMLKHGAQTRPDSVRRFVDFLFTAPARAIFQRYGYLLP